MECHYQTYFSNIYLNFKLYSFTMLRIHVIICPSFSSASITIIFCANVLYDTIIRDKKSTAEEH